MAKRKIDIIHVMGIPFEVHLISGLSNPANNEPLHGETDVSERIISIESTDTPEQQLQTLFHEVLHAGLYLTGQSQLLDGDREESLVLAIENAIYPLLPEFLTRAHALADKHN